MAEPRRTAKGASAIGRDVSSPVFDTIAYPRRVLRVPWQLFVGNAAVAMATGVLFGIATGGVVVPEASLMALGVGHVTLMWVTRGERHTIGVWRARFFADRPYALSSWPKRIWRTPPMMQP